MDAVFVRGIDTREDIDRSLLNVFHTKGYAITDVPVIHIMEGYPMDSRAREFSSIYELSGVIADCFRDTDVFQRAFVLIDDALGVMYLMFTQTTDATMPEIMDLAMETIGNA